MKHGACSPWGVDPSHQQKVDAAKAKIEDNNTFKAVALEWIAKQEREEMADITLNKIRWLLDKAYPKIGARPIAQVTAYELLLVLRSIEATGRYESARRMRSVLGRIFRYAVATTRAERDPTGDLRGALTDPKSKHLAAITTPNRAGDLMRAIEGYMAFHRARSLIRKHRPAVRLGRMGAPRRFDPVGRDIAAPRWAAELLAGFARGTVGSDG